MSGAQAGAPTERGPVTWAVLLDELAADLDRLELRISSDDWGQAVPPWSPPATPATPPSAEESELAAALAARLTECTERLWRATEQAQAELADLGARRHAAQRYTA